MPTADSSDVALSTKEDIGVPLYEALPGATRIPRRVTELSLVEAERYMPQDKALAVKVLKEVAKELPPEEATRLTKRVLDKAYTNFEDAIGGRQELVDALALSPDSTASLKKVQKLFNDPDFGIPGRYPLFTLCQRNRVPLADLVQAFRDATIARLNVEALTRLAKVAPKVVEQVGEDAQNRKDECHVCDGRGRIQRIDEFGEFLSGPDGPLMRACPVCHASGSIYRRHDAKSRDQFLRITGIIEEGKAKTEVNVNQQLGIVGANFTPGEGTFERLVKALDGLHRTSGADVVDVIDVEPIISPDPATEENAGIEEGV